MDPYRRRGGRPAGCAPDRIAKPIVFRGERKGRARRFLTAGGNRGDPARASVPAGEPLGRAAADPVRRETGLLAIGGVASVGPVAPVPARFDPPLTEFGVVRAAAGTPRLVFALAPAQLLRATGARLADFTARAASRPAARPGRPVAGAPAAAVDGQGAAM